MGGLVEDLQRTPPSHDPSSSGPLLPARARKKEKRQTTLAMVVHETKNSLASLGKSIEPRGKGRRTKERCTSPPERFCHGAQRMRVSLCIIPDLLPAFNLAAGPLLATDRCDDISGCAQLLTVLNSQKMPLLATIKPQCSLSRLGTRQKTPWTTCIPIDGKASLRRLI